MRFDTLTRGVALGGALTLCCAGAADAATGGAAHAAAATHAAAAGGAVVGTGEQTPLHLGGASAVHAASSGGSGLVRTLIALVIVVAIIYAIARIMRAIKGRDAVRASGTGLESLATLPLAPGRSVALVRSGSDIVLVGVGEHGVTPIKTYTEAEALAGGIEIPRLAPGVDGDRRAGSSERLVDRLRRLTVRP